MNKILLSFFLTTTTLSFNANAVPLEQVQPGFAKNVIILIPDGMSTDGITLTRWVYNDGKPLNLDPIATGLVRTHNSDTIIADSAPAGTAMATGHKTQDKLIGVLPAQATLYGTNGYDEKKSHFPVASVLELAKLQGKSVGIVATSEIMHATPAAFTAHVTHRKNYSDITEQIVFQNIDVVFGGGQTFLEAKNRDDGEDMLNALTEQGYRIITNKHQFEQIKNGKVWGLFSPKDMPYDIDRKDEPSLAELTKKSIALLQQNDRGFLLVVEGSKIDWAAHANAPAALISDIKAFDDAVGEAVKFAKSNHDTLVIIASDHGNGGVTIGNRATSDNYSTLPLTDFVATLRSISVSEETLAKLITDAPSQTTELIEQLWQFTPDPVLIAAIQNAGSAEKIQTLLSETLNQRSLLGWTSGGHTGQETVLYVYSPDFSNTLTGTVDNTDLARYAAKAINGDLSRATEQLFVSSESFKKQGIQVKQDNRDAKNIRFTLTKKGQDAVFHQNRSYFERNNEKIHFNGVVVYNGKELFIPQAALDKLNG